MPMSKPPLTAVLHTLSPMLLLFLLLFQLPGPSLAAEMAGVSLPETLKAGDKDLVLTGMGVRTKFIVKVYVAGLYMEKKPADAGEIVASDQARALVMRFVYSEVSSEKLRDAWKEGFDDNTPNRPGDLAQRMDQFLAYFTAPALKGDEFVFSYLPGNGTTVTLKGKEKGTIPGADFASALFAIWFGEDPADSGLKKSVLKGL